MRVTRNGTPVGVMLSVEQFERLRGTAWDRLATAMDAMSQEAAAKCLTPDHLVTGDGDLLAMSPFHGIPIITPTGFLALHGQTSATDLVEREPTPEAGP